MFRYSKLTQALLRPRQRFYKASQVELVLKLKNVNLKILTL